jgi:hypothetical protein
MDIILIYAKNAYTFFCYATPQVIFETGPMIALNVLGLSATLTGT